MRKWLHCSGCTVHVCCSGVGREKNGGLRMSCSIKQIWSFSSYHILQSARVNAEEKQSVDTLCTTTCVWKPGVRKEQMLLSRIKLWHGLPWPAVDVEQSSLNNWIPVHPKCHHTNIYVDYVSGAQNHLQSIKKLSGTKTFSFKTWFIHASHVVWTTLRKQSSDRKDVWLPECIVPFDTRLQKRQHIFFQHLLTSNNFFQGWGQVRILVLKSGLLSPLRYDFLALHEDHGPLRAH